MNNSFLNYINDGDISRAFLLTGIVLIILGTIVYWIRVLMVQDAIFEIRDMLREKQNKPTDVEKR